MQESRTPTVGGFTFGELMINVLSRIFPEPKRPLRPNPQPRAPANTLVDRCALLVQLVGGRNIPLRAYADSTSHDARRTRFSRPSLAEQESWTVGTGRSHAGEAKLELDAEKLEDRSGYTTYHSAGLQATLCSPPGIAWSRRVSAFVELQFQGRAARTTASEGSGAYWKETVSVPFDAPNGIYGPQTLMQINNTIQITVFDEVLIDDASRGVQANDPC